MTATRNVYKITDWMDVHYKMFCQATYKMIKNILRLTVYCSH